MNDKENITNLSKALLELHLVMLKRHSRWARYKIGKEEPCKTKTIGDVTQITCDFWEWGESMEAFFAFKKGELIKFSLNGKEHYFGSGYKFAWDKDEQTILYYPDDIMFALQYKKLTPLLHELKLEVNGYHVVENKEITETLLDVFNKLYVYAQTELGKEQ